jgi:hypothetical protein
MEEHLRLARNNGRRARFKENPARGPDRAWSRNSRTALFDRIAEPNERDPSILAHRHPSCTGMVLLAYESNSIQIESHDPGNDA